MEEAIIAFRSRLTGILVQYHIQAPSVLPRFLRLEIELRFGQEWASGVYHVLACSAVSFGRWV